MAGRMHVAGREYELRCVVDRHDFGVAHVLVVVDGEHALSVSDSLASSTHTHTHILLQVRIIINVRPLVIVIF